MLDRETLGALAASAEDEAGVDLILMAGMYAPADRLWCYWNVN